MSAWTKEKPTKEGRYWRYSSSRGIRMCELEKCGPYSKNPDALMVVDLCGIELVEELDDFWIEIETPEPPKDAPRLVKVTTSYPKGCDVRLAFEYEEPPK